MLEHRADVIAALRCPRTGAPLAAAAGDKLTARGPDGGAITYPVVQGLPVLIDFSASLLDEGETLERLGRSVIARREYRFLAKGIKRLLSPAKASTTANVLKLLDEARASGRAPRVLVIGGGSIGNGMQPLYGDPAVRVYAFDLYVSPNVQFIADAHQIPFADNFFDAVVIQAVLEHVIDPATVVAEIWRVLKTDGIVYSETPFMQQVHEGAYDFTRFSESGHRYLFRRFSLIASGVCGGPGIQLMWSADYFARGLFRSRIAGKIAKLAFFWAQYFDALIPERFAIDGASGVFFMGRKAEHAMSPREIVAHYRGAQ